MHVKDLLDKIRYLESKLITDQDTQSVYIRLFEDESGSIIFEDNGIYTLSYISNLSKSS